MNKKNITVLAVIIICTVLISQLIGQVYRINIYSTQHSAGQITINQIKSNQAIALDGYWEFYWNQLLGPEDFAQTEQGSLVYYPIPRLWKGLLQEDISLSPIGTATYRLIIDMDLEDYPSKIGLALKMPFVYSAYNLWLNGELIASNGQVGLNKAEEKPVRAPKTIMFSSLKGENELILQISNHHFYRGGISSSILLGQADYVFSITNKQIALDIFMAGSFFISGVLFFLLYLHRRDEKGILYFALICIFSFSRTLLSNEVFISNIVRDFNWAIGNRIEASFSYVAIPLAILLFGELYKKHFVLKYLAIWKVVILVGIFLVTLAPHVLYDSLLPYLYFVQTAYILYIFTAFIKYYDKGTADFYILFSGKLILAYYAMHDILVTYKIIDSIFKLQLGIYIFTFILGYAIILYLYREFGKVERLVTENQSMLTEITRMNQELEQLVEKRTQELEESNRQLYELSICDGLTKIPNRLRFDQQLSSFLAQSFQKGIPLAVLFLDIDFFKNYNDSYGHLKGDETLKAIANSLHQEVVRDEKAFMARYGGEEFVVLYLNRDKAEAYQLAEKLRNQIADLKIPHQTSQVSEFVTISIGGISLIPKSQDDAKSILSRADDALYRAKKLGRNRTYMAESIT